VREFGRGAGNSANSGAADGTQLEARELIALRNRARDGQRRPRQPVRAARSGSHTTPLKGRGVDFAEVRTYLPGDDVRSIDWRVTARTGRVHTKVFIDERERPVLLLVDLSSSMRFGSRTALKSVAAGRAAALLAWAAIGHGDRVGGVLFADDRHVELRPMSRTRGALQVIAAMCKLHREARPSANGTEVATTAFARAMTRLARLAHPGSVVYVLSDFLTMDQQTCTAVTRLSQHCDLTMGLVYDPVETEAPPPGYYRISDGRRFAVLDLSDRHARQAYASRFEAHRASIEALCRRNPVRFFTLSTAEPTTEGLREGLWPPARKHLPGTEATR